MQHSSATPTPTDVLHFWFNELDRKQHFVKDPELDQQISQRFGGIHAVASTDKLPADSDWRTTATGKIAEIIVLDQFSRQIYRDDARAWESDALALSRAKSLVADGTDRTLTSHQRQFVYMPFMHAESIDEQEHSVALFTELGDESSLRFAILHRDVIARFGRFPYRNKLLGRASTTDELAYVAKHGSF